MVVWTSVGAASGIFCGGITRTLVSLCVRKWGWVRCFCRDWELVNQARRFSSRHETGRKCKTNLGFTFAKVKKKSSCEIDYLDNNHFENLMFGKGVAITVSAISNVPLRSRWSGYETLLPILLRDSLSPRSLSPRPRERRSTKCRSPGCSRWCRTGNAHLAFD